MVNINAQDWLDKKYPANGVCQRDNDLENKSKKREDITHLDIRKGKIGSIFNGKNLAGSLNLEGFTNLEELNCPHNKLTSLKIVNCPKISYFGVSELIDLLILILIV